VECPVNYEGSLSDSSIPICAPSPCGSRSPNTPTLCVVYEDADTAVECVKINDSTCSTDCLMNMVAMISSGGLICDWIECNERVPVDGVCSVPSDVMSYCYSLTELGKCYAACPSHTSPNTQTSDGIPRCVVTPCTSRTPDSRGMCLIEADDECYIYNGVCLKECPQFTIADISSGACQPTLCAERTPGSNGLCRESLDDECFVYTNETGSSACVAECPIGTEADRDSTTGFTTGLYMNLLNG
jgi:hypothetical protein